MASFRNQSIIVIKAPPEAKIFVPHPSDGLILYFSSDTEPIEVFLCSTCESNNDSSSESISETLSDHELTETKSQKLNEVNYNDFNDNNDLKFSNYPGPTEVNATMANLSVFNNLLMFNNDDLEDISMLDLPSEDHVALSLGDETMFENVKDLFN